MATIKAIEGRSIHQIQSGQVIVDLKSVVKELVENSLDAGATSVEIRFKANGLDAVEVQDNGSGIAKEDYESLGLKHYTSKLSNYDDLAELDTFGFRGEALSSLCALSNLHIVTARDEEAPKGTRLDFEQSGKLKSTSVAATQKGTLVAIENLFHNLPVRRRELEKNIKREYAKVIGILNSYACVSTGVRFTVTQQAAKGKRVTVFSTRNNLTTRENIANVYGAKTILALVALDLELEMLPTAPSQMLKDIHNDEAPNSRKVVVQGHISKPIHGEGRQTPDRQMFFVNSRPCGLPQVAKAFNEVYRSYNVSQSPFIFANLKMDTNAYDVNVSPDKQSIMLHDQQRLLESLKEALVDLFESQDQTIPTQQSSVARLPSFKPLNLVRTASEPVDIQSGDDRTKSDSNNPIPQAAKEIDEQDDPPPRTADQASSGVQSSDLASSSIPGSSGNGKGLISNFAARNVQERKNQTAINLGSNGISKDKQRLARKFERQARRSGSPTGSGGGGSRSSSPSRRGSSTSIESSESANRVHPDNEKKDKESLFVPRNAEDSKQSKQTHAEQDAASRTPVVHGAMTVGPTMSRVAGEHSSKRRRVAVDSPAHNRSAAKSRSSQLSGALRAFIAPGSSSVDAPIDSYLKRSNDSEVATDQESVGGDQDSPESDEDPAEEQQQGFRKASTMLQSNSDEEQERRLREEARVQKLVEKAERTGNSSSLNTEKRAARVMKRSNDKVHNVMQTCNATLTEIETQHQRYVESSRKSVLETEETTTHSSISAQATAEERLSLTISKPDFARMQVVGQFNLGFILAVRPKESKSQPAEVAAVHDEDELFIIDQHASDEIYNFHRLSATTTLTPQPLVRPHPLQLTAIEEETILDHIDASLAKNGFNIEVDTSGAKPVGERCSLMTLPTSKETVFDTRDLEELLVMLADAPAPQHSSPPLPDVDTSEYLEGVSSHRSLSLSNTKFAILRPTKVRKMLAMRACRSSIMVGKALTQTGMERVLVHMGEIERPWNCPHGRPTMRHLSSLGGLGGSNEWSGSWREYEPEMGLADSASGTQSDEGADSVWLPQDTQLSAGSVNDMDIWETYLNKQQGETDDTGEESDSE